MQQSPNDTRQHQDEELDCRKYFDCANEACEVYRTLFRNTQPEISLTQELWNPAASVVEAGLHSCASCERLEALAAVEPRRAYDYLRCVTQRQKLYLETTLKQYSSQMNVLVQIIETSPDMLIATDMNLCITLWNEAGSALTGFRREEILGQSVAVLFDETDIEQMMELLLERGFFRGLRTRIRCHDNSVVPLDMSASLLRDAAGEPFCTVGASRDIRELLEKEQALKVMAETDALTGLHNRRYFDHRLVEAVQNAARYGQPFGLMIIDVDRFKQYNDRYGHPAGDTLLREVAGLMQKLVRMTDTLARIGGEEFALITPNTDREGAVLLAQRMLAQIQARTPVTVSIGLALYEDGDDESVLYHQADKALYSAKREGRNRLYVARR
ncbi:sensor domain-containing diguanylate cyclase [Thiohalophilus sp.]|uniref:GGDEF domain-containing protein n=1 Tax=Thiohalophilus sp. TaxID=3028392 RepID=UPI002ACDE0E5|nr:sensor domain-containing diguanylate cyclase [Thiohalophilus sp.]MDZ7663307.1 sensor domain-containing diguanylate cyclase [Thiohalophilus sp.]